MSIIKVVDVTFVRFTVPDLDVMERFLLDFGFEIAAREADAIYARGLSSSPYLHVTQRGPAAFTALAFEAASVADLETLARAEGTEVRALDGPGGGKVVRLTDPDGFRVEVVAGREPAPALPVRASQAFNFASERERSNEVKRVGSGPSQVMRLGHCVLKVTDFRRSEAWYKSRFGLITSDEIEVAPDLAIGAFMRSDRGEKTSDHHTLFLLGTGTPEYEHAAFEVPNFDDLMHGHYHLVKANYQHDWGVGRHILGSQIFDYWRDPWGHNIEHWTDGDQLNAAWGSRKAPVEQLLGVQWGPSFEETHGPVELPG
jgi:catechol-2,3-dioxygenase